MLILQPAPYWKFLVFSTDKTKIDILLNVTDKFQYKDKLVSIL